MSWLHDVSRKMEKICLGSQDLGDNDDSNDKFSYFCHSLHPPTQCKGYDSLGDSQVEDLGEPIPFFLNLRHSYMVKDRVKTRMYAKTLGEHALELEEKALEFQKPFYEDTEIPGNLSKEEDHSWTNPLPVHQTLHVLQTASTAPGGSYDSFQCGMGKHLGMDAFAPWAYADDPYLGYPEHTRGAEPHMMPEQAIEGREVPSLLLAYDVLRTENTMLKRVIRNLQSSLERQACMVQNLEKHLRASLAKEESKAQELQYFVQQTEQSLHLMTQRALEAESNVEKLKEEISVLQGELQCSKAENENLKAGQTMDMGEVKHNIDFALQNLHKIITGANWSIRQLASGAESLCFVAEVLKSTGRISTAEAEKES
ncbi:endosome-associated-trafficking regulator 1-like [Indicator indicator]|uniref:endosome-associated-trafficking regulator 1-like n=1 Tax=Indicator indicator TaxID=1002788 RepID=UPI0023DEA2B2|nr:endosome-associated-trafficking regulator 1-like [Indicator indicator]